MIKAKEISPQTCDMGFSYEVYECSEGTTLKEALAWLKKNKNSWGTITIQRKNGDIVRKFDYDVYRYNEFYTNLAGWESSFKIIEMTSHSCFMNCDIEIQVQ